MTKQRPDLGFGDELEKFDPQAWTPEKAKSANDRPRRAETHHAAQAAGFSSRELVPLHRDRRRRTGRNVQFNLKARQETIEAFCNVADANGWGLGETLERAVELLEREYPAESKPAGK